MNEIIDLAHKLAGRDYGAKRFCIQGFWDRWLRIWSRISTIQNDGSDTAYEYSDVVADWESANWGTRFDELKSYSWNQCFENIHHVILVFASPVAATRFRFELLHDHTTINFKVVRLSDLIQ